MKYSQITILSVLALAEAQQSFEGCDIDAYYSSLGADSSMFDRDGINALVKGRHNVLPFTNQINPGNNDVWAALIDVDAGAEPNSVKLIYEDKEIPAVPFGQRGWIKDHLFPILRGVGITGPDLSDLHGIRASSPLADIVRGIKYYGECGVLVRPETCQSPAEGGAADTCSCNRLFTPPMDVKGDIARALMYMDIRYDGTDANTRDLRLTDCPFQPERDMAYLSQMLTWHVEDPPDEGEILRNDKICQNWQGNRNPFVDLPELASQLWGPPLALPVVGERLIYEACEAIPTLAPTFTPNQCELYSPGDFVVWLMNSDEPSTLAFYSFAEMPEGFELFITDNPWNGEEFVEQEGTLSFTAPEGGLKAAEAFGFGADDLNFVDQFQITSGTPQLHKDGEPVFIYCIDAAGDQRPLLAFNYGGEFKPAGQDSYGETESALPENLGEEGLINLPHFNNYLYVGPSDLDEEELKAAVRDPKNWEGSDSTRYGVTDRSASAAGRSWALVLSSVALAFVGLAM